MKFKQELLPNGLRLIVAPMPSTNIITTLLLVGVGSKYETKNINGISHFLEHMFFKGTKRRPTALAISEAADKVGGEFNAFTGKELTGFYVKVDAQHLELALDLISDMLLNSKFSTLEINKEKGVIIEEINSKQDMPIRQVSDLFEQLLYGDQPAGWEILGNKESVTSLERQDFINYLRKNYLANNAVLCLSGALTKDAGKIAKKYFSGFKQGKLPAKQQVYEKQTQPQFLVNHRRTDQAHLCLGVRAYDLFHPDHYVLKVLSIILGGNMSSRLFTLIREKYGLAYYVRSTAENYTDSGHLVTQAGVDNKKIGKTIDLILGEYKKIKEKKVGLDELNKAKEYIKGSTQLNLETSDEMANYLAAQDILTKKVLTIEEQFDLIDQVSAKDIQRVAQDIFQPNKLNLAIIGPVEKNANFAKMKI